ncbi:RrF2 family transcriptional regulator [Phaeacidiphilus oryzae]|uniref:RrF2 family transcriptional regulator n=1 Tax=Phaeacidiphilus oryzae TaxID=348818 RepID=UPI0005618708|nr:Rrf2 family transcriptional regulator [Phaeacidiphilus oryzae]
MKLSQGVEWALHCVTLLAQGDPGTVASRHTLAGWYGLPEAYLAKHLKSLVRAGVLHAGSGPRGGFRLARPPEEITALEVVESIDGPSSAFVCTEIRQNGACAAPPEECVRRCAIDRLMQEADAAWRERLRRTPVSELAAGLPAPLRGRAREWLAR